MMMRRLPSDPFSPRDFAAVIVCIVSFGSMTFLASVMGRETTPISEFFHHSQVEAEKIQVEKLLATFDRASGSGAIGIATSTHKLTHTESVHPSVVAFVDRPPHARDLEEAQLREMYERAMAPGVLRPHE
jgi:hypothetical protein